MLQDFLSVSEHFGTLCIKGLKLPFFNFFQIFTVFQKFMFWQPFAVR